MLNRKNFVNKIIFDIFQTILTRNYLKWAIMKTSTMKSILVRRTCMNMKMEKSSRNVEDVIGH